MKAQDIVFFILLIVLLLRPNPRILLFFGLGSLLIAIPLFAKWIFFTAERLTWYAGVFFFFAIVFSFIQQRRSM